MKKSSDYLEILYELHRFLNSALSLDEILNQICQKIAEIFALPQVVIFLVEKDGKSAKIAAEKRKKGVPSQIGIVHKFSEHPVTARIIRKKWILNVSNVGKTKKLSSESKGSLKELGVTSLLGIPIVSSTKTLGILFLDRLGEKSPFTPKEVKLAKLLGEEIGEIVRRGQLFEEVRELNAKLREFSQWSLGKEVLEKGLKHPLSLELKPANKVLAFIDIRGFTQFTDRHTPKEIAEVITTVYELCEKSVLKTGGRLQETKGDEVFLIFDHLLVALKTILEIRTLVGEYLSRYGLSVGIGVSQGEVLVGLLGTTQKKDYRLVGSPINIAKGLERLAKNNEIYVTREIYLETRDKFVFRYVGTLDIKGKKVKGYRLLQPKP